MANGGAVSSVGGSGAWGGGSVGAAGAATWGRSIRRGVSMASLNAVDSTVTALSDGSAASGVCHWKASSRPVTGDTGRQRSDT